MSVTPEPGFKVKTWIRLRQADLIALAALLCAVTVTIWHRWIFDNWFVDYDILTFFLPWFGMVGDRLRDGDIPGWNSHFASGMPMAGDPSGGWLYVPVMIAFTLFKGTTAFKLMVLSQVLIASFATYTLCRLLGYRPPAALLSAIALALGPLVYAATSFGTIASQVSTWIPVALLGVELSLRAQPWLVRASWWSLTGFAISQFSVAWPGQGMVNALLILAAWIGYRSLLWTPDSTASFQDRFVRAATTGFGTVAIGLGLGAAGILPRLSFNEESSIAGGDYSRVLGANYEAASTTWLRFLTETFDNAPGHRPIAISGVVLVLALFAVIHGRNRYGIPFFVAIYALALALAFPPNLLHDIFYLIPTFETLHEHGPRRLLWIMGFAPAMLAGAGLQALIDKPVRSFHLIAIVVPLAIAAWIQNYLVDNGVKYADEWFIRVAVVAALLMVLASIPIQQIYGQYAGKAKTGLLVALIGLVFVAPTGHDILDSLQDPTGQNATGNQADPSRRYRNEAVNQSVVDRYDNRTESGTGAAFLQDRQQQGEIFRYAGYAGRAYPTYGENDASYSSRRLGDDVYPVLVSGRAGTLQLQTIQVYDPAQLGFYFDYVNVMNGELQDYHWLDPFPAAYAGSQLFDMLNVRYIVVTTTIEPERLDIAAMAARYPVVYQDAEVIIFENPYAFDRAWIVHEVLPDQDGFGIVYFRDNQKNAHQTAFVEDDLPTVQPLPPNAGPESVTFTHYEDDAFTAEVTAAADGLVVFSEIYADGWKAWVDGKEVDIVRANTAFRAVPVPAGTHTIEMRYDPDSLRYGLVITGVTGVGVIGIVTGATLGWDPFARFSGQSTPGSGSPAAPTSSSRPADTRKRKPWLRQKKLR